MKISFVVPAYNEESLLPACLEAIQREIADMRADAEIIVVNNASTDHTREVALAVAGVRVVDESKKGLVMARQAGLVAAQGEIVANIDADVRLPEGWLGVVVEEFNSDPKLVCLSGPFIYDDLPLFTRAMVRVFYALGFCLYVLNRFVLRVGSMVQGGNFVIRRDAMIRAGGFDTSITFYGEDTDVAKRLRPLGGVKWTFRLPVYTSGRRLKGEGVIVTSARYTINYFWVTFFGKPFTYAHKDIRPR